MNIFYQRHQEKIRYLIIGGWNTVFGYLLFVGLYRLLGNSVNYSIIFVITYLIGISNAYFCYKVFVFKTKGNYIKEHLRFYLVYGVAFIPNLALLPFFVEILKINPLGSQALIVIFTVIISYLGHKNFSFAEPGTILKKKDSVSSSSDPAVQDTDYSL